MIVHPETYADKGCWISDDHVYAFVSSDANGVTEIGYHGAQPASRNARVFFNQRGVLRLAVSSAAGVPTPLLFTEFDWMPDSVRMRGSNSDESAQIQVAASGREIRVVVTDLSKEVASLTVQLDTSSMFSDVHGRRTWSRQSGKAGWAEFALRDEIVLDEWMKREGPYGCDFLIPEPLRRKIFRRRIRSGLATPGDLLPEHQHSSLRIYDARVRVEVGGDGYCVSEEGEVVLFTVSIENGMRSIPPFVVRFDSDPDIKVKAPPGASVTAAAVPATRTGPWTVPIIAVPGFSHVEQFFSAVPGLVDSCMIRDLGIPRATPGGYYWIWAWDALVTALASLRWGGGEIAEGTAAFVEAHRDEECIPMRWTHDLEALDTQPPGALETLLASLVYALSRERQGTTVSGGNYARMREHLQDISERSDRRGFSSNIGFYPDLPLRFGRTEESTVAMETAAFYSFCRVTENCALQAGDMGTARVAQKLSSTLERSYCEVFWDKRRKFFIDSVEKKSGLRNESYPIFTLLFLHHAPAIQLVRSCIGPSAAFIAKHLLTPMGIRMLPRWDKNAGSETVSGSWYPHWDAYALKLLRRGGRPAEIMTWLKSVERVLERLGYAPEYLMLDPSLAGDSSAWLRHGAASNLNCATGWYQALLEGIMGLEFDPGGLTLIPLGLPLNNAAVRGVFHLGTQWDVKVIGEGPHLEEVRVDGRVHRGCLKIPMGMHDGARHEIEQIYGEKSIGPHFMEVANAEVLDVASSSHGVEISLNALGQVDLAISAPDDWILSLDGKHIAATKQEYAGPRIASLVLSGRHTALISRRS